MALDIRPIRPDEVFAFRAAVMRVFGGDARPGEDDDRFRATLDLDRVLAAFEGGAIVGTAAAFTFQLSVPGGVVPMGGLTMVTVPPSHRRRGLLRELMRHHFEDVRRRGEPLSGLWASEASIYGRFGYGPAAEAERVSIDVRGTPLDARPGVDEARIIDGDALREQLPPIFERVRPRRPGVLSRTGAWWKVRTLRERPEARAGGASRLRAAVTWRGERATGYALYRQRSGWEDNLAAGKLEVVELLAEDGVAEATLLRLLCRVDLFPHVTWWNAPSDSLLPWVFTDRRRVKRHRIDSLWVRPCDVAASLSARAYAADGALRLHVEDTNRPENAGTYALCVEGNRARCARTDAAPELRCDPGALGAVYLGAVKPSLLARAGRLDGERAAIARADAMFAWPIAAWCPEVF